MKRLPILALLASLSFVAVGQPKPIKDAMHSIYSKLEEAYNKQDVNTVMSYMSSDYSWKMLDAKTLTREDAKAEIKSELTNAIGGTWHIDIKNLIGAGPVATVVVQYQYKGLMKDESGSAYQTELTSTERQNWIQAPSGWRQISDTILDVSTKTDGRRVVPNLQTPNKPVNPTPPGKGNDDRNNTGHGG